MASFSTRKAIRAVITVMPQTRNVRRVLAVVALVRLMKLAVPVEVAVQKSLGLGRRRHSQRENCSAASDSTERDQHATAPLQFIGIYYGQN